MYSYAIVPVIALFCYMFLLLSLLAAKKNGSIHAFMGVLLLMVIWTAGSLFMRLEYWPSMEFWFHVSLAGLLLFPVALFLFLRTFIGETRLYGIPFWAAVIVLAVLVNWKTGIFLKAPVRMHAEAGGAYVYEITGMIVVFFVVEAGALVDSIRMLYACKKKNVFLWTRLMPIWIGIGFLVVGNICLLFPVFKGFPIDVCAGIPMAICLYYALYKKRVFQLSLLVSKANCYVTAFFLTMLAFYRLIPSYEQILKEELGLGEAQITMAVSFSVVFASWLLYIPLKKFLDSVFETDEVKYSRCIGAFSTKVSQLMNVNEILTEMVDSIRSIIPAEKAFIFLVNENGDYELSGEGKDRGDIRALIPGQDYMLKVLKDTGGSLLMRDYKRTRSYWMLPEMERQRLSRNRIECVSAIRDEERYLGLILLASKTDGKAYGVEDLDFLTSIGSVASIAVKNSLLYETAYAEARRDYLTGVANRKYFYEMLQQCCEAGSYEFGTLLMVNVDDFKLYNQLYGNEAGDDALKRIAEIICQEVPEGCFVARHAGKEFAVLLPGHPVEETKTVAEKLSETIKGMNRGTGEYPMKILTVSCGIALGICPMPDYHELINHVEMAVFYAKQAGKNRIVVYTEGESQEGGSGSGISYQTNLYSEYASTIYALTAAIDAKDHYTFSHSENVAYYSQELARAYGMNEEGINIVYQAGMLHDIGKIGIEESILNKPGKLTDAEYETMKTHVEMSIGIIRHLPSLEYLIPAVIGHHERYDGNGYPRRIKGEEIPLMARILCVADSFDAMVSARSYKPKMEVERALEILQEEAGKQFDPKLVPVFVRLVEEKGILTKK